MNSPKPVPAAAPRRALLAALAAAEAAGRRAKKEAPIRYSFLAREEAGQPIPPMTRILRGGRGGRGGDVRLRLYVSLLWMARDDATFSYPARAWATLLGLPDPETKGERRIKDALNWLDDHDYLRLEAVKGRDSVIHLLDDGGSGKPYELPGKAYQRLRADREAAAPHRYVRIPRDLWTQGWMSLLSGPGLAMLLVLFYENRLNDNTEWVWFSPSMADLRYGLSEDTRTKGMRELVAAGLVQTRRRSVSTDIFDYRRVRKVHMLNRDRLREPAEIDPNQTDAPGRIEKHFEVDYTATWPDGTIDVSKARIRQGPSVKETFGDDG